MDEKRVFGGTTFTARTRYEPAVDTPRHARRLVDEAVHLLGDGDALRDEARLLTSEVVADAVHQRPSYVDVRVDIRGDVLRVEVSDDPGLTMTPGAHRFERRTGRHLLDVLARRWGSETDRGRTTTWFELVAH